MRDCPKVARSCPPLAQGAAERSTSALLWQWTALLQRVARRDMSDRRRASRRQQACPDGQKHRPRPRPRRARGGFPAASLFEQAIRMSPTDGDVMLGYAAALFAEGRASSAELTMEQALVRSPLWIEGHLKLAQLRSRMGKRTRRRRRWSGRSNYIRARSNCGSRCSASCSNDNGSTRWTRRSLAPGSMCHLMKPCFAMRRLPRSSAATHRAPIISSRHERGPSLLAPGLLDPALAAKRPLEAGVCRR